MFINNFECSLDIELYEFYIYLISTITNTDKHGIMNEKGIQSLFLALEMPVLFVEVTISINIFRFIFIFYVIFYY